MTSLASKDTSGVLTAQAGEAEDLRTRGAKRFRLADAPDGRKRYRVGASVGPIHYQDDPFEGGDWHEIDLDVVLTPNEPWDAACESNGYQVRFWQTLNRGGQTHRYVAQFRRAGKWLGMAPKALAWENDNGQRQLISVVKSVGAPTIDNDAGFVQWNNAFGAGLHFRYNLQPDKFFKALVIESKSSLPLPTIGGPGLKLTLALALEWDLDASPGNGFAEGVTTELGDGDTSSPDETLDDPEVFDHRDSRGSLWWVQRPLAWDSAEERHDVPVSWRLVRKGGAVYGLFSVAASALNSPQSVYPVFVDAAIAEQQVAASEDDGYWGANGNFITSDSNLYLQPPSWGTHSVFIRLASLPIPRNVTIDTASASVSAKASSSNSLTANIAAADADSAAAPTSAAGFAGAARTSASASWVLTSWTANSSYTTPDLSAVVQSVVDRAGWAQNNALVLFFDTVSGDGPRTIWPYDGSAALAPRFNATYTELAPPDPPDAPSNLQATAASSSQINLTWDDNSDNETGFKVEYDTDPAFSSPTQELIAADETSYSVTDLPSETLVYFRLASYNSAGDSDWSSTANATTNAPSIFPADWQYKRQISIAAGQKSGAPSGIVLTLTHASGINDVDGPLDADGSAPSQNGGGDLRASSDASGATQIPLDVLDWTTSNDPASATAELKVALADLDGDSFYLWWGSAGTESQPAVDSTYGREAVYDSDHRMVLSLNENPAGSAPQFGDRTANGNSGTANGSMTSGQSVTGKVGRALNFDGSNDYVEIADDASLNLSVFTFSCWVNLDSVANEHIFQFGTQEGYLGLVVIDGKLDFYRLGVLDHFNNTTLATGQWYSVTVTKNGDGTNNVAFYLNGAADGGASIGTATTSSGPKTIGRQTSAGTFMLDGRVDEVCIYSRILTTADIATKYNCENNQAAFWDVGAVEDVGGGGETTHTATAALTAPAATFSGTATFTPPAYTASATLTVPPPTLAASATHAPPTFTAFADLTFPAANFTAAASATAPTYTGTAALVSAPATFAASGETTPPVYTASADLTLAPATFTASGTSTPPVYTATAELTTAPATLAGTAISAAAVYSATAALTAAPATFAASGTTETPTYTASGELTSAPATFAALATHTPPSFTASAELTLAPPTLAGSATAGLPTFTASGSLVMPPATLAASGTFTSPVYTASAALVAAPAVMGGVASFEPLTFTGSAVLTAPAATFTAAATFEPAVVVPVIRACLTISDSARYRVTTRSTARYAVTTQDAPRYTVTISDEAC